MQKIFVPQFPRPGLVYYVVLVLYLRFAVRANKSDGVFGDSSNVLLELITFLTHIIKQVFISGFLPLTGRFYWG
ncbi:MAG: hypothetical protein C4570_04380 [Ammonifex sp.]|nr:MAG: hypothetical protein C4570_04380 [Ammonifex sp.]